MSKITKNTILKYVPDYFVQENTVNTARVFSINNKPVKNGRIIYLCEREIRAIDNFALQYALQKSEEFGLPLKIIHPKINYEYYQKSEFIDRQIKKSEEQFREIGLDFEVTYKNTSEVLKENKTALLVTDFNPILNRDYIKNADYKIYEIDSRNIVPARFVSEKQEYSAATLRGKIYKNISQFLTEYKNSTSTKSYIDSELENFIKNKLPNYSSSKNDPSENTTSGLSKYLNLGFISTQRVVLEVIKSDTDVENKEAFLEEIIVRQELSDNFCLYTKNFKDLSGIANWAKLTLQNHKYDIRPYIYTKNELENAQTHDKLWNATQIQLIKEGTIHGYLRMYWAKKISEWSLSPENGVNTAIYLNDKYAYDSPSANGYTGILWAIGGLHDRAFSDCPVTGKIRRMTYNSIKRKYNLREYFNRYLND